MPVPFSYRRPTTASWRLNVPTCTVMMKQAKLVGTQTGRAGMWSKGKQSSVHTYCKLICLPSSRLSSLGAPDCLKNQDQPEKCRITRHTLCCTTHKENVWNSPESFKGGKMSTLYWHICVSISCNGTKFLFEMSKTIHSYSLILNVYVKTENKEREMLRSVLKLTWEEDMEGHRI